MDGWFLLDNIMVRQCRSPVDAGGLIRIQGGTKSPTSAMLVISTWWVPQGDRRCLHAMKRIQGDPICVFVRMQ